jgi:hypothetical protein
MTVFRRFRARRAVLLAAVLSLAAAGCRSSPGAGKSDVVSGASLAGAGSPAIAGEISPVDSGLRVLVVYFSRDGATERVARDLAALLAADIERVVEKRQRRWGFFGFMGAGAASSFGVASPVEPPARDPADFDVVVACTPIWAWHMAPPMRSWLRLARGRLPPLTAYVTVSGDTDPSKVVAAMAKEAGRQPIVFAGFVDRDFESENRPRYLEKIGSIVDRFR